ncbi:MAG: HAD family hydrolase [Planctomycetes bacterium]|nr:HAD family hydrolase [Planctomycetota bacterium]
MTYTVLMSIASRPRAVIFDLDGTLTVATIDFDAIRAEIGLPNEPILEAVLQMPPAERARAEAILHRHEIEAAEASRLQPFAVEVVAAIRAGGIPVALMTRNSRWSARHFMDKHGLAFDFIRAREDGPMKPSPEPIHDICRAFAVSPTDTWAVGDFRFDLICANAAGSTSVLFHDPSLKRPDWADEADHVINSLKELLPLMGIA